MPLRKHVSKLDQLPLQILRCIRPLDTVMKVHLDQTLAEASDELTGHYGKSVRKYDRIEHHMLMMADELSAGIVAKFPNKFR